MQFFIYFLIIFWEKSLEAVTMATGMQPKELGINYLVLCDNTKTQKVSSKSMTMRAKRGLVVTENCYYMLVVQNLAKKIIFSNSRWPPCP